jgi:hypothetical protein
MNKMILDMTTINPSTQYFYVESKIYVYQCILYVYLIYIFVDIYYNVLVVVLFLDKVYRSITQVYRLCL